VSIGFGECLAAMIIPLLAARRGSRGRRIGLLMAVRRNRRLCLGALSGCAVDLERPNSFYATRQPQQRESPEVADGASDMLMSISPRLRHELRERASVPICWLILSVAPQPLAKMAGLEAALFFLKKT